jgi:dihydroorotase
VSALVLRGGRVVDPSRGVDAQGDLSFDGGVVVASANTQARVLDASGSLVLPGLVDLHATLESARDCLEALEGGFTTVLATPQSRQLQHAQLRVLRASPLTEGCAGEVLGGVPEGARCLSDGARSVARAGVLRRAMEYAQPTGLPIFVHCEDVTLSGKGVLGAGPIALRLGLPSVPVSAELAVLARDLVLAAETQVRLHVMHVTSAGAVALLREARARGVSVTADVGVDHLMLTDAAAQGYQVEARVWPPLRSEADRAALRQALAEGTLDAIASDHVRVDPLYREAPFAECAPGSPTFATLLSRVWSLGLPPARLVEVLSLAPARLLGLPAGTLAPGSPGDAIVVDAKTGKVRYTVARGEVAYAREGQSAA